eukprot:scaffold7979_cov417-Prasinococcus_capsulatus_cf.AAC.9
MRSSGPSLRPTARHCLRWSRCSVDPRARRSRAPRQRSRAGRLRRRSALFPSGWPALQASWAVVSTPHHLSSKGAYAERIVAVCPPLLRVRLYCASAGSFAHCRPRSTYRRSVSQGIKYCPPLGDGSGRLVASTRRPGPVTGTHSFVGSNNEELPRPQFGPRKQTVRSPHVTPVNLALVALSPHLVLGRGLLPRSASFHPARALPARRQRENGHPRGHSLVAVALQVGGSSLCTQHCVIKRSVPSNGCEVRHAPGPTTQTQADSQCSPERVQKTRGVRIITLLPSRSTCSDDVAEHYFTPSA